MVLMRATKFAFGVESAANSGCHVDGWEYNGATPPSGSVFRRTDLGGDGGKEVMGVRGVLVSSSFAEIVEDVVSLTAALELTFFPLFSNGAFMILHNAPQFATGISISISTGFDRGGNGGGRRGLKPGASSIARPDSLVIIVE